MTSTIIICFNASYLLLFRQVWSKLIVQNSIDLNWTFRRQEMLFGVFVFTCYLMISLQFGWYPFTFISTIIRCYYRGRQSWYRTRLKDESENRLFLSLLLMVSAYFDSKFWAFRDLTRSIIAAKTTNYPALKTFVLQWLSKVQDRWAKFALDSRHPKSYQKLLKFSSLNRGWALQLAFFAPCCTLLLR